jgi:hypothetical protein
MRFLLLLTKVIRTGLLVGALGLGWEPEVAASSVEVRLDCLGRSANLELDQVRFLSIGERDAYWASGSFVGDGS